MTFNFELSFQRKKCDFGKIIKHECYFEHSSAFSSSLYHLTWDTIWLNMNDRKVLWKMINKEDKK